MVTGIQGTGPYGLIRSLQNEINQWKYELSLIKMGIRSVRKKRYYEKLIDENRSRIREIKKSLKEKQNPVA